MSSLSLAPVEQGAPRHRLGLRDAEQLEGGRGYVGEDAFTFGYEDMRFLRLHMTNEEKYSR